jgi:two-component system chemotaxis response regulator CheY
VKTCLIVDDSRVIRVVARRILENLGCSASEACDGAEALEQCREAMPDAVLLDWNMPVMNGFEFLDRLRCEPGGDRPRVILCSVENDLEFIRTALDRGADEYVMKPFDADILASKLDLVAAA